MKLTAGLGILTALWCAAAQAQPLTKLQIGEVATTASSWPMYVAQEKGLFAKHGVEVTVTMAGSAANVAQQTVGGAFDIGVSTCDTVLRAAASGAKITLLGTPVTKYPYSIMTQPDIKSAADLKGKTIILAFQKDITTSIWTKWVREQGLDPKSIDQVYDGATPNRYAALAAKRVEAAFVGPPFDFRAEREGYRKLLDFGAYATDYPFTAIIARNDWLAANRGSAEAYLGAISDAVDWLYDPANRAEAASILTKVTKQDIEATLQTYDYYVTSLHAFASKLRTPEGAIENETAALIEMGDIKTAAAVPKSFHDGSWARR